MPRQRSTINMAEPLRFWRAKKRLSQLKLAELAETSALTISQLESGKRSARGTTMEKILSGLKLSRDEFFAMREGAVATAMLEPASAITPLQGTEADSQAAPAVREATSVRLSNLDLELLNRILNLDFEGKLDALRFLQNLK